MLLSWPRRTTRSAARNAPKPKEQRSRRPFGFSFRLGTELLEDRIAPAATLSLAASGFTGATNSTVMNFPIGISALSDGAGHVGLASATLAITYPPSVFGFPTGSSLATADVNLGAIPLSDTAGAGGANDWTLTANSPVDGQLNISLTAKNGDKITTNTFPAGGTLVTVNFPILASATPSNEAISVVSASGSVHTQVLGGGSGSQTYILAGLPASGTITVTPGVQNPPSVPATESYSTEANTPLSQPARGLLTGASDPQGEALSVGTVNGSGANVGVSLALASGAALTVQSDGSFVFTPAADFVGSDGFAFQAIDTGGSLSNTGTVTINVMPTLTILPTTIASGAQGTVIEEDIYLDNPNPPGGVGPLSGFNLAITYDSTALATAGDGSGIHPGPDLPADLQSNFLANVATAGVIGIGTYGSGNAADLVTGPAPLKLASIEFVIVGKTTESTPIQLVTGAQAGSVMIGTLLTGAGGVFPINPPIGPEGSPFVPGVDTLVNIQGATPLALGPASMVNGDFDAAYEQTITASGGTAPYTFALISCTLPPGLALEGDSGVIAGTATAAGNYSFTVRATDADGIQGVQSYTLTIMSEVSITTTMLADWTAGQSGYSQTFTALGGVAPYTFTTTAGTLPPGLTLGSVGLLSGTPSASGSYPITVTATDGTSASGSQTYTLTINPAVTITTATLPNTPAGVFYNQTIAAAGGTGPLVFSSTGTLPPGLTFSTSGVISGTPTTGGSFSFTVIATDAVNASASQTFTVIINPVTITTATLASWTANLPGYSQIISATGGAPPFTFSVTGTLPPGLILSSDGFLVGTPTTAGSFNFTVTVTDSISISGSRDYVLLINPAVSILTPSLAAWTVGQAGYYQSIVASGGTGTLVFSSTALPPGLTLSVGGVLSGNPGAVGSFSFVVSAIDALGYRGSQGYTLTINPLPVIATDNLTDWTVNQPGYHQSITVNGGTGSITFAHSGTLPPGLLFSTTAVLSGTPTTAGTYTFSVAATDATGATSRARSYTVVINSSPQFQIISPPPSWPVSQAGFVYTVAAVGGTGSLTFSALASSVPPGLTLSRSGVLFGTPVAVGSFSFTVFVTDVTGASVGEVLTVPINPGLIPTTLPNWTVNQSGYNESLAITGGTVLSAFSVSDTLPTGLVLSTGGVLSGTPTVIGAYTFTISAVDSVGTNANRTYHVTINPAVTIATTTLPDDLQGVSYSLTLRAEGGTGALTFTERGTLPTGLTLSTGGVLSGRPTISGIYVIMVTATDSVGAKATKDFTLVINAAFAITTASLADGMVGAPYSQRIQATGGTTPYTFVAPTDNLVVNGSFESGNMGFSAQFTFNPAPNGLLAGGQYAIGADPQLVNRYAPSYGDHTSGHGQMLIANGTQALLSVWSETVPVLPYETYRFSLWDSSWFSVPTMDIRFNGVSVGTPSTSGTAAVWQQFTTLWSSGSATALTIAIFDTNVSTIGNGLALDDIALQPILPPGVTFTPSGVLSGTPTTAGVYNFTVTATDAAGASVSQPYTLTVHGPVVIAPSSLPNWDAGLPGYNQTFSASGALPLTFSVSAASLPPGLGLSSVGMLRGTPTVVGSYTFTVTAMDVLGASGSQTYTLTINPSFSITTSTLPDATVNTSYNQTINSVGGTGPFRFVPSGNLIANGNFEAGNLGFASQYTYAPKSSLLPEGDYDVVPNPTQDSGNATSFGDHTTGHGFMLMLNGATTANTAVWTEAVAVAAGNSYIFSLWDASWYPASAATLAIRVNGVTVGSTTASLSAGLWQLFSLTWNAGAATSATISIYDTNVAASGNDFALDDIALQPVLPPGLTLNSSGILTGIPTTAGTYNFTVTAIDAAGARAGQPYTLTVNPAVQITTASLANGTAGQSGYSQTIHASGGTGTLTFSAMGSLPPGLTLSSSGVLAGMPTAVGNYSFTVTATDAAGASASHAYTVMIGLPNRVYVDPSFQGPGQPASDPDLGLLVGVNAFATITAGLVHVAPGGTLVLFGGTYPESTVNFNVPLGAIDIATNPGDPVVLSTVTMNGAVTLASDLTFDLIGVATGTGVSTAANLAFGSTVDGPGSMTINGNAMVGFNGPISTAIDVTGGQLEPTSLVVLVDSGKLTLEAGLSETIAALASTSSSTSVELGNGSNLTTGAGGFATFAGSIGGPGQLTKVGSSTFTLSGDNTYTGATFIQQGTLTLNGTLEAAPNPVILTGPTSILDGSGSVLRPVLITSMASGAMIRGSLTISNSGGVAVDVDPGPNNVTVTGITVTGSNVGILAEPGSGNHLSITDCTITGNLVGLEVLNGCISATGNIIGSATGPGNNVGVYLPAVNPNDPALPVDPLLTLESNQIVGNTTALQNATTMGVTAILNWWGSSQGARPQGLAATNAIVGLSVQEYTPYVMDETSAGPNPSTFDVFQGTASDGNVYLTGTLGADTITATVDAVNTNLIHVTGTMLGDYLRGGASNRLIVYSFGDNLSSTRDVISVNGSWDAEIHAETMPSREPLTFAGSSNSTITTTGSGSDVIFGGGNDTINANTSGNNVLVAGLSTGRTGAPTAPRLSGGSGANLYIAGSVDDTLAPQAPSGRLDYDTLRAMDDLWAAGLGGMTDAMSAAALFSVVNTPGAILTGSARATILLGSGHNWFIVKGTGNPVNTPTGNNADYVAGSTASPNYRQAVQ
jgi:autotransporter-associated beta strand protein